jgi:TRAP-type C4-dicarboxylate transport system permease small subunit
MMDVVIACVSALIWALRVMAGMLLAASVTLNFANVIGRYFFNTSIYWAEEMMLFLMVGCVFFGNGVVAWSGRQIRMDVVVGKLPEKVRRALDVFSELVLIVTALTIVAWTWPVVRDLYAFDQRSQAGDFPLYVPQALIPIGLAIMALLAAVRLVSGAGRVSGGGPGH